MAAGEDYLENDLLFPPCNDTPFHQRNNLRDFKKILKDAGLPANRFHDLRHPAASLVLNQGVLVITISKRLGHARPSIPMDIYGHLVSGMQREAAENLAQMITPVPFEMTGKEKVSQR